MQCKSEVVPNRAHHPQTQLSMSKLALLASEPENGNGKMEELNRELSIIEYQLNIPDAVLEVKHNYNIRSVVLNDVYRHLVWMWIQCHH